MPVLAVAALPALAFVGVPLISMDSAYFVDTGATTSSVHVQSPVAVVAAVFALGVALVFFPRRVGGG